MPAAAAPSAFSETVEFIERAIGRSFSYVRWRTDAAAEVEDHVSQRPRISAARNPVRHQEEGNGMNNIIYIVGLVVIIVAILSFFGLR